MSASSDKNGRPLPSQELLLKAALLQGEAAVRAWTDWTKNGDLGRLDPGSHRLVPLLYRNLRAAGVVVPLDAMRIAYRKSWMKNRLLFEELGRLLRLFEAARIDTLLLKGAALIQVAYKDYGARPMADLDVLVPLQCAPDAIDLMEAWGWRSTGGLPRRLVGVRHADEFTEGQNRCDLHWNVLQECNRSDGSDDFWSACHEIRVGGARTHVLCPADQLLHVCLHGARSSFVQPVTWIADAMTILKSLGGAIDWDRLVDQTTSRHVAVPMREALRYLRSEFAANIPPAIIDRLNRTRTSRMQRLEHKVKIHEQRLVGTFPVLWFDYWRWAEGGFFLKTIGFPRYLQITFRTKTLGGLPLAILRLAARRIFRITRS